MKFTLPFPFVIAIIGASSPSSVLGQTQIATTTRYWDCSGGACGCGYISPNGGEAHCYSNGLFAAPNGNELGATFYGAAAISEALGGGYWRAEGCGKCWKLTGQANVPGESATTTVVLKGTNFCPPSNSACSDMKFHFDIAAPGFDFLGASQSNTCTSREQNEAAGFASCGRWMIDSQNPNENCNCNAFSNSVLVDGCENFRSLGWNNPQVTFEEVNCPPELSQLPCWEENGGQWPPSNNIPELCLDPLAGSNPNPTPTPPVPAPTNPVPAPTNLVPAPTNPVPAPTNPVPAPVPAPTNPAPVPPTNPGCGICGSAPGMNQAECNGKPEDICLRMIQNENKCSWSNSCDGPTNPEPEPDCGACQPAPGTNQAECNGQPRNVCQRMIEQENKCSFSPCRL